MGVFSSFKEAIFGKDDDKDDDERGARPAATGAARPAAAGTRTMGQTGATPRPAAPKPIREVDVEQRLDAMDGADRLNWRSSIVDLMKLIGLDSGYENRKELAQEMGRSDYEGSAEDNQWLHKRVMTKLASAGGKVPASLRD